MRARGVRLANAHKNVGRPKYSFNSFQRQFMPAIYKPPIEVIDDMITSTLHRDTT
ncbi:unnamed protein product [Heterosigma akashiwo]